MTRPRQGADGATRTAERPEPAAPRAFTPEERLADVLQRGIDKLKPFFDQHLSFDKLLAILRQINSTNPTLASCTPDSILESIVSALALGLNLHPQCQEAYLIPRKNKRANYRLECQFQPSYRGVAKLLMLSGQARDVQCRLVYEGETFRVAYTPDLELRHECNFDVERSERTVKYVYAYAKRANGEPVVEVLNREQIERRRARSAAAREGFSPWQTDPEAMFKKMPMTDLKKWFSLDHDVASALDAMEDSDRGPDGPPALPAPAPRRGAGVLRELAPPERPAPAPPAAAPAPEQQSQAELPAPEFPSYDDFLTEGIADWQDWWTDYLSKQYEAHPELDKHTEDQLTQFDRATNALVTLAVEVGKLTDADVCTVFKPGEPPKRARNKSLARLRDLFREEQQWVMDTFNKVYIPRRVGEALAALGLDTQPFPAPAAPAPAAPAPAPAPTPPWEGDDIPY